MFFSVFRIFRAAGKSMANLKFLVEPATKAAKKVEKRRDLPIAVNVKDFDSFFGRSSVFFCGSQPRNG